MPTMPSGTSLTACAGTSGSHSQWLAGGRRDRTAIVAARPYLACSEYGPWSGRPCRGTGAQRQAACHRASGPASQAWFQGRWIVLIADTGSVLASAPAQIGSFWTGNNHCYATGQSTYARRGPVKAAPYLLVVMLRGGLTVTVVSGNLLSIRRSQRGRVMLDWVTRAICPASSGSMRLGTRGRRQASWATGNPPGHLWNPPYGIACSSRFRAVCDREGVPGRGVRLRRRSRRPAGSGVAD